MNLEEQKEKFEQACGERFSNARARGFNEKHNRFNDSNLDRRFKGWLMHERSNEQQVGELREQLATMTADRDAQKDMKARARMQRNSQNSVAEDLHAKLDTAMGLLRDVREHPSVLEFACVPYGWIAKRNTFLNTTSTEGKDHEA